MSSCGAQPREMRDIGYGKIDRSAKAFLRRSATMMFLFDLLSKGRNEDLWSRFA